jgi:hypothetical protein
MKKLIIVSLLACIAFISCDILSPYGKKVNINPSSEVYYKGDGVTEADAVKLGEYLLRNKYFDSTTKKSVQITKDTTIVVKFVIDETKLKDNPLAEIGFMAMKSLLQDSVFNGQKIKVILANTKMKSIKTVADFDTNPVDSTQ